jgi:hypothetical protein
MCAVTDILLFCASFDDLISVTTYTVCVLYLKYCCFVQDFEDLVSVTVDMTVYIECPVVSKY